MPPSAPPPGPRLRDLPHWTAWNAAVALSRIQPAMADLGLLLAGQAATGSLAGGGVLVGAYTLTRTLCGPLAASWMAKRLHRRLQGGLLFSALGLLALAAAVLEHLSLPWLVGLTLLAGLLPGGVSGGLFSMLGDLVPERLRGRALSIDATLVELVWLSAPLLVTASLGWLGAPGPVALMAISALLCAAAIRSLPDKAALRPVSRGQGRALKLLRQLWPALLISFSSALAMGMMTVCLPAQLQADGTSVLLAGPLLSLFSLASGVGGALFSGLGQRWQGSVLGRVAALLGALGLGPLAMSLAHSPLADGAVLILFGSTIAPLNGLSATALMQWSGESERALAYALSSACFGLGYGGAGLLLAKLLGQWGAGGLLGLAGAVALASVPVCLLDRRSGLLKALGRG